MTQPTMKPHKRINGFAMLMILLFVLLAFGLVTLLLGIATGEPVLFTPAMFAA